MVLLKLYFLLAALWGLYSIYGQSKYFPYSKSWEYPLTFVINFVTFPLAVYTAIKKKLI